MKIKFAAGIILAAFLTVIFQSCQKENIYEGIIVSEFDFGRCFPPFGEAGDEYVITNDSLYRNLLKFGVTVCENYTLPDIDFSTYTLLGKYTVSDGEPKYYKREVIKDENRKKYIYSIFIKCKNNYKAALSMNWVLVPKLPEGYSVEFSVEVD